MTSTALDVPLESTSAEAQSALAPAAAVAPGACANCGAHRAGEYCGACGQRAVQGRLTVPGIAQQVAHDVLNVDRGILFTALELTRRPGDAIRDYVDGKRVRYTAPVKYFVLTVALTTFLTAQLGVLDDMAAGFVQGMGNEAPVSAAETSRFLSQWMTVFMALGVPFTAAVTRLLFRRARMTYAEHLALNLYSYGHQCLVLALVLPATLLLPALETGLVTGWLLTIALYFGWTCARFFRVSAWLAVPLGFVGMIFGTVLYFLAVSFVVGVGVGVAKVAAGG
jgi:hypothetical protein